MEKGRIHLSCWLVSSEGRAKRDDASFLSLWVGVGGATYDKHRRSKAGVNTHLPNRNRLRGCESKYTCIKLRCMYDTARVSDRSCQICHFSGELSSCRGVWEFWNTNIPLEVSVVCAGFWGSGWVQYVIMSVVRYSHFVQYTTIV